MHNVSIVPIPIDFGVSSVERYRDLATLLRVLCGNPSIMFWQPFDKLRVTLLSMTQSSHYLVAIVRASCSSWPLLRMRLNHKYFFKIVKHNGILATTTSILFATTWRLQFVWTAYFQPTKSINNSPPTYRFFWNKTAHVHNSPNWVIPFTLTASTIIYLC